MLTSFVLYTPFSSQLTKRDLLMVTLFFFFFFRRYKNNSNQKQVYSYCKFYTDRFLFFVYSNPTKKIRRKTWKKKKMRYTREKDEDKKTTIVCYITQINHTRKIKIKKRRLLFSRPIYVQSTPSRLQEKER